VITKLKCPPVTKFTDAHIPQNYIRFRISPDMTIAMGVSVASAEDQSKRDAVELEVSRQPQREEMEAYERVLTDAMVGDSSIFARQDYVEEAWRIVDPVLKADTPVYTYEPHSWGPKEADALAPPGGWVQPVVAGDVTDASGQSVVQK
jgi:glucose-6-phosphate 1-dehydrogenase